MREVSNKANNAELKLFLEVELGQVMLSFLLDEIIPSGCLSRSLTNFIQISLPLGGMDLSFVLLLIYIITQDLQPVPPPERTKEDIMLYFKLYDPSKEELR